MRWLIVALSLLFLLSSAATGWALYFRFEQTNKNRVANANIWHAVVCDIERSVSNDKDIPLAQRRKFVLFYDNLLVMDARATPCNLPISRG